MKTMLVTNHLIAVLAALTLAGSVMAESQDEEAAKPERPSSDEPAFTLDADDPALEWLPCPDFMPGDCRIAILQGDPEEGDFDLLFRLQPGTTAPRHWHTSAERMVLLTGELHLDFEGQDALVMDPGTYAYGPPGRPHSAHCAEGDACLLFIAFEEHLDAIPY